MDPARGWQVISIVTAVAGLGAGSLFVGRSVTTEVAPIDLDFGQAAIEGLRTAEDPVLILPEIVPPVVREDRISVSPVSVSSAVSVDEADPAPAEVVGSGGQVSSGSGSTGSGSSGVTDSADSDTSVDSVSSVSSVG